MEDRSIVLTATNGASHVTALLSLVPYSLRIVIRVDAAKVGEGEVVSPPRVAYGAISMGLGQADTGFRVGALFALGAPTLRFRRLVASAHD